MKKSRFTDEQIVLALQQAELGASAPDVGRKLGISDATLTLGARNTTGFSLRNSNICGNRKRKICGWGSGLPI